MLLYVAALDCVVVTARLLVAFGNAAQYQVRKLLRFFLDAR